MAATTTLGYDLVTVVARLHRWASRGVDLELPIAQARLLALLADTGPARIGDLARADHSSQPTVTSQLQQLRARGFVTRAPDPHDARASIVRLSEAGAAAVARIRAERGAAVERVIADLDPERRDRIRDAVAALHDLLDAADASPPRQP